METDQVDVLAGSVPGDFEEIDEAEESGLARELRGDFLEGDLVDRIDFDVAFLHAIAVAGFDVRIFPDADAAGDFAGTDAVAETPGENHMRIILWSGSGYERKLSAEATFPLHRVKI